MRHALTLLILVLGIAFLPSSVSAQWQVNGVPVSTAAGDQQFPTIVSDGAGGAIVTWYDQRSGTNDIYAQRVNAAGIPQWTADGVALCTAVNNQSTPKIVSDGAGGAIVTWNDQRSGTSDIYAQRVNASGVPQWTANGIALSTAASVQAFPTIDADGAGGAIVTWQDFRSGTNYDIYTQRVSDLGVPQWTANGVALSTAANFQTSPTIVSDGAGGAIITWEDKRSLVSDIYAQRVSDLGVPQWTANGVALSTAANVQTFPTIASDGASGAIVTWNDYQSGSGDIYTQRVNASGVPQWTADGVALSTAANNQLAAAIVSNGAGGAIVTWTDYRSGGPDIYGRGVNNLGVPQWTADGVALSTAFSNQTEPTIVPDGAGGAIVAWRDFRDANENIYAQRVSASGAPQWTADGVALSTAANDQISPTIAADGAGGAIVTWMDYRSGPSSDIYAQRLNASGDVPTAVTEPTRGPSLIVGAIYPNPFAGTASLDLQLTTPSTVKVEIFDVAGRAARAITLRGAMGSQRVEFDGRDDAGRLLPNGVYFYRVKVAGETITRNKMVIAR